LIPFTAQTQSQTGFALCIKQGGHCGIKWISVAYNWQLVCFHFGNLRQAETYIPTI
jgi:hypothetical protein